MTPDLLVSASQPASESGGLIAFAVVAALFVAALVLYRSLRRQLGKIDFGQNDGPVTDDAGPSLDDRR